MAGPQAVDANLAGKIAAELNAAVKKLDGDFSVSVDRESGMIIVRITDQVTGEIVRQIPPQELLDADHSMEKIVGLLVDDRA
ncbi:MAG: flagellar protein FlaG [Gemmatimonadota bacterium]